MLAALNVARTRFFFITGVPAAPYASFRVVTLQTIRIRISKAGGAFADPHAGVSNCTEVGSGWYKFAFAAEDADTLGQLAIDLQWPPSTGFHQGELDQVVTALPGDPGQLTVAERIASAQTMLGLADGIELGLTPQNALRCIFAVLAGKSAAGSGAVAFQNFGDTIPRVQVTYDATASRISVTYDFS